MGESGLPPGRTGIETCIPIPSNASGSGQDYPPAGLGLRQAQSDPYPFVVLSGLPPGRTGIETDLGAGAIVDRMSGLPPGRTGIETLVTFLSFDVFSVSGLPPGRTGIETTPWALLANS